MNVKTFLFISSISIAVSLSSCGENKTASSEPQTETTQVAISNSVLDLSKGESIFKEKCIACHHEDGKGVEGAFPPLAGSDYLLADKIRAIKDILGGKKGEVTVNGKTYNQVMPPNVLTDEETVEVVNYILNSWGNKGGTVTVDDVKAARK